MLIAEKLRQAADLVAESNADVWLTFVRETFEASDPALGFLVEGGLTWQSALLVFASGKKAAVVGSFDADPLIASGNWDEVIPYVEGIRDPLLTVLDRELSHVSTPKIAVNYSLDDCKSDGLSQGMYQLLVGYLEGTRFENALVSAESVTQKLRSRKSKTEVERIRIAIHETGQIFHEIERFARVGRTELDVYNHVQALIHERGHEYAWDKVGNPIVNSGPDSMVGHGVPSGTIQIKPGHILHIDLGIRVDGYSSDLQRCWFVGGEVPAQLQRCFNAVRSAIEAAENALNPGVRGWQVDAAARSEFISHGFPEYMHATGHQVGRVAHDGGAILGPRWERYGSTPCLPIEAGHVYTLELGAFLDGYGYLGLEEMALVTQSGCSRLSEPQTELWKIAP